MTETVPQVRVMFQPHDEDDWYDEVLVRCVERWKDSEYSGDEWRFSYYVEFKRKGHTLLGRGFSRLAWALAHVPALGLNDYPAGADDDHQDSVVIDRRYEFCFQPGCPAPATREFRILKLYDRGGNEQRMFEGSDYRRRFCDRHAGQRGDCGLGDADSNYVEVPYGSPGGAEPVPFPMTPTFEFTAEFGPRFVCPHPDCHTEGVPSESMPWVWELPSGRLVGDDATNESPHDLARRMREHGRFNWREHMREVHGFEMRIGEIG